ncbi:MAG: cation:proton antiporter family protein [Brumimicrobium sp.]
MEAIYIDAIWLGLAFLSGILMKQLGLPALLGFLATGFFLNYSGFTDGNIKDILGTLSNLGITLLLFTIGLKIKIKALAKKEIWITASVHMLITTLAFSSLIFGLSYFGLRFLTDISLETALVIGFSLSFSSTVFIVKSLEEKGEITSTHGRFAIGVLIIQDIFAVIFLTVSKNVMPSIWVLTLPIYLYVVRFLLYKLLDRSGHGELLTIFGFFAPFIAGALVFEILDLKSDLGALIIGMILVNHKKSEELYDRMMSYKDFFLIGFFINIGLAETPSWMSVLVAFILLIAVFFKGYLFLLIFSRFNLRARTNFLTSMHLMNYSEFGLIVGAVAVNNGILSDEWLVILALLMSFSFLLSSPITVKSYEIFDYFKEQLTKINRTSKDIDFQPKITGEIKYVVVGIGSIGGPAFEYFNEKYPGKVVGVDYNNDKISSMKEAGYNAVWGDTTDREFWEESDWKKVDVVVLSMSDYASNFNTLKQINKLKKRPFKVATICHYDDEQHKFEDFKVDYVYNYKTSVGQDFAQHAIEVSNDDLDKELKNSKKD